MENNIRPLSGYFAGGLFNAQELHGNLEIARAIKHASKDCLSLVCPQDVELQEFGAKYVRENDLFALLKSDFIICNFNGLEIDSGTVVEYMTARFMSMPTVQLRTDFRDSSNTSIAWKRPVEIRQTAEVPYNLMLAYDGSVTVLADAMQLYCKHGQAGMIQKIGEAVVGGVRLAFEKTQEMPIRESQSLLGGLLNLGLEENTIGCILEKKAREIDAFRAAKMRFSSVR